MFADAVYFVEGCGQGQLGANWGDGFATDARLVTPGSSNDPTRFFTTLVGYKFKCDNLWLACAGTLNIASCHVYEHLAGCNRVVRHNFFRKWRVPYSNLMRLQADV